MKVIVGTPDHMENLEVTKHKTVFLHSNIHSYIIFKISMQVCFLYFIFTIFTIFIFTIFVIAILYGSCFLFFLCIFLYVIFSISLYFACLFHFFASVVFMHISSFVYRLLFRKIHHISKYNLMIQL